MVDYNTLEPFGVVDLHLRSQERPPVSGRVPDKCPYLFFSVLGIERSGHKVGDITLKSFGAAGVRKILQCQEGFLMRVQIYIFKFWT